MEIDLEIAPESSDKILDSLRSNSKMTILELLEIQGISTRAVEKNIKKLKNSGALKRVKANKGGHYLNIHSVHH